MPPRVIPPASWHTVAVALRLADALREEPNLLSQMHRASMLRISTQTIQDICRAAPPGEADVATVQERLGGFESRWSLVLGLEGERLLSGEWCFAQPRAEVVRLLSLLDRPGHRRGFRLIIGFKPALQADHAACLRVMHENVLMAERPYSPEDVPRLERMIAGIPWYCVVSRELDLAAVTEIRTHYLHMVAQARITRTGLAALCWRQTHHVYPTQLSDLALDGLTDPFTEKPLLYRADAAGFVAYSTGPDQRDDGGRNYDKTKGWLTEGDIVWRCTPMGSAGQTP